MNPIGDARNFSYSPKKKYPATQFTITLDPLATSFATYPCILRISPIIGPPTALRITTPQTAGDMDRNENNIYIDILSDEAVSESLISASNHDQPYIQKLAFQKLKFEFETWAAPPLLRTLSVTKPAIAENMA